MGGKGSLTVGRVRGIPVRLHFTFLIILPYIAWVIARTTPVLARLAHVDPAQLVLPPIVLGLLLGLGLFTCVLLHELAHVFVGLRGGAQVQGITLMIVGGVSEVSEFPSRPSFEAAMAVAGPLASFVLGFLAYVAYLLFGSGWPDARFALHYLTYMNVALAIFNLLPAFPMDGGRILRALLTMLTDRVRATRIAAWVGQGLAALFLLGGLFSLNWVLILIGALVVIGARSELEMVRSSSALEGLTVEQAMLRFAPTVEATDPVGAVIARMERELRTTYFVLSQGELVGTVSLDDVRRAQGPLAFARAGELMRRDPPLLAPEQALATAARLLRLSGLPILPVLRDRALLGSVSLATIAAAVRARDVAKASAPRQPRHREAT